MERGFGLSPDLLFIMQGGNMFYLVLKNTVAGGKRVQAGDVIELTDANESSSLVAMGRVEATSAPQPKEPVTKKAKKVTNRAVTDIDFPEAE